MATHTTLTRLPRTTSRSIQHILSSTSPSLPLIINRNYSVSVPSYSSATAQQPQPQTSSTTININPVEK